MTRIKTPTFLLATALVLAWLAGPALAAATGGAPRAPPRSSSSRNFWR